MRTDIADILIGMGFILDHDFTALQESPTSVAITWLSSIPMPTEIEIDNAAPTILASLTAFAAQRALDLVEIPEAKAELKALIQTMQALIDSSNVAQAAMDVIITGYDAANANQRAGMVKDLARSIKQRVGDINDIARTIKRIIRVVK
jgi:hypothetical protein